MKILMFNQNKYKVRTESIMCYSLLVSINYVIIIKFAKIVARRLLLLFFGDVRVETIESNVYRILFKMVEQRKVKTFICYHEDQQKGKYN